jgi:LacI family transcriptional regulator
MRLLGACRVWALGIVVPQLNNPVFSSVIRGAEVAASALSYSLIISDPGRVDTPAAMAGVPQAVMAPHDVVVCREQRERVDLV